MVASTPSSKAATKFRKYIRFSMAFNDGGAVYHLLRSMGVLPKIDAAFARSLRKCFKPGTSTGMAPVARMLDAVAAHSRSSLPVCRLRCASAAASKITDGLVPALKDLAAAAEATVAAAAQAAASANQSARRDAAAPGVGSEVGNRKFNQSSKRRARAYNSKVRLQFVGTATCQQAVASLLRFVHSHVHSHAPNGDSSLRSPGRTDAPLNLSGEHWCG